MRAAIEHFRSRGSVVAVCCGLLSLFLVAMAWHRGRTIDWLMTTPLVAVAALLAAAAADGFLYGVSPEVVEVRILGLSLERIQTREIARLEVDEVSPIWRYGGWGVRGTRADRAYLAGTGRGVRLHLRDREVLLGCRDAEALHDSIVRHGAGAGGVATNA